MTVDIPASVAQDLVNIDNTAALQLSITYDGTSPVLSEVTPVTTPTSDTTPDYTFNSTEIGDITYGGDCSSATNTAIV